MELLTEIPEAENLPPTRNKDFLSLKGEMSRLIRGHDWAKTALGPLQAWPQSLKTSVNLILNSQHPMWIGWGPELTFLYNDAYISVLSRSKHPKALGRPASEVWKEIWDVCGPLAEKVMRKGEASYVDSVQLFMKRGDFLEETYYSFSYSPIQDESGNIGGLFCPSAEHTATVLSERRLKTLSALGSDALVSRGSEAACEAIAATLSEAKETIPFALLYLTSPESKSLKLAKAVGMASGIRGISPIAIDLSLNGLSEKVWELPQVFRKRAPVVVPVRDATHLPLGLAGQAVKEVMTLPLLAGSNEDPIGAIVCAVNPTRELDVSYRAFYELLANQICMALKNARAFEETRQRAEELAEIDRAKTRFFSNVSHEFRTPLTLMLGPLEETLADENQPLAPQQRERLDLVYKNSLRLLKLVNSLLDFSRIEAGRAEAIYEPTNLGELTRDLASVFRSAVEKAGIRYTVDAPDLPEPAFIDREMWEKIVLNLLSNALKFTFEGEIKVSLFSDVKKVNLAIQDTGTGIPQSELGNLFKRFHRIEGARGRSYEGSGIGLALIQELAKLHGGSIRVKSEEGKGSTFTVSIPWGSAHLPNHQLRKTRESSMSAVRKATFFREAAGWTQVGKDSGTEVSALPASAPVELAASSFTKPKVLVVDDNADLLEYTSSLLTSFCSVESATNGEEALNRIRSKTPDLVVSDVMMPKMGGFELLKMLRTSAGTRELPVILLSARAGEEASVEGLNAGATDYLAKPFAAKELIARVRSQIELARLRRDVKESHARMAAFFEQAPVGFCILEGPNHVFSFVNPVSERALCRARSELLGKSVREVFPEIEGQGFYELLDQVYQNGEPYAGYGRRVVSKRVDGSLHEWFMDFIYHPRRNHEGKIDGILTVFTEVTEQKRAKEAKEVYFRSLIDASPAMFWITAADGVCTYLSSQGEKYFAKPMEAAMGFGWLESVHPEDRSKAEANFKEAHRKEAPFVMEHRLRRADGVYRHAISIGNPKLDDKGNFDGYVGIVIDVHDRHLAEEALKARAQELSRSNAELAQFAYIASHDLKEPLRVVRIQLQLIESLMRGKLDPQVAKHMEFAMDASRRMYALIDDLLEYARVGVSQDKAIMFSCDELVAEVSTALSASIAEAGANIEVAGLPQVFGIPTQIRQVFQNLIGNSLKYRGNESLKISIAAEVDSTKAVFSVKDNGMGFDPEYSEKVFELFQRLHNREAYPGTGIGLSICKKIIEQHGGRIWVESAQGAGANFKFSLPTQATENGF